MSNSFANQDNPEGAMSESSTDRAVKQYWQDRSELGGLREHVKQTNRSFVVNKRKMRRDKQGSELRQTSCAR